MNLKWQTPIKDCPGFEEESRYKEFLANNKEFASKKGKTESRINRYVQYLNNFTRVIGRRLTPDMVETGQQINDFAPALKESGLSNGVVGKHRAALRLYCKALNNHEPR